MKRNKHLFLIRSSDRSDWGLGEDQWACTINTRREVAAHATNSKNIFDIIADPNNEITIACLDGNLANTELKKTCAIFGTHLTWVHFGNAPTISLQAKHLSEIWNDAKRPYRLCFGEFKVTPKIDFQTYNGPLPYSKLAPLSYDKIIHQSSGGIAITVRSTMGKIIDIGVFDQLQSKLDAAYSDGCKHFFDTMAEDTFAKLLFLSNNTPIIGIKYSLIRSSSHKVVPILGFINAHLGKNRREIGSPESAPLLIIVPDGSESIQFEDIIFWRKIENADNVLVFDAYARIVCPHIGLVPWLQIITPNHTRIPAGSLQSSFNISSSQSKGITSNFVNAYLQDIRAEKFWKSLRDLTGNILAETPPKPISVLYYELVKLGANHLSNEHKVNQLLAAQQVNRLLKNDELNYDKYILDTCEDLLQACRFAFSNPSQKILLIDDRPELIQQIIGDVTGMDVDCWNPFAQPNNENLDSTILLQDLVSYTSLDAEVRKKKMMLQSNDGTRKPLLIEEINSTYNYILVDVLFVNVDGLACSLGSQIIGGASRLLQDIHRLNINRCKSIPLLIAISRTDDTQQIHSCLRAGAVSYILKSRITALPGLLGRLKCSSVDTLIDRHHNFRALYRLPTETISILKSLHIKGRNFAQPPSSSKSVNANSVQNVLAELLVAIPKADLHVHAASVMSIEFIFIGAFVTLLRHDKFLSIKKGAKILSSFFNGTIQLKFPILANDDNSPKFSCQENGVEFFVEKLKEQLTARITMLHKEIGKLPMEDTKYRELRNILHHALGICDYLDLPAAIKGINKLNQLTFLSFALATARKDDKPVVESANLQESQSDVLRFFILWLGVFKYTGTISIGKYNIRNYLSSLFSGKKADHKWGDIRELFYSHDNQVIEAIANYPKVLIELKTNITTISDDSALLKGCPTFVESPLEYLLASGTRCSDLKSYLVGCELAGADFMRHPYLFRLYAQQTVHQFNQQGILYAELRAAVSGYEDAKRGFTLDKVYQQFTLAFTDAQALVQKQTSQQISGHITAKKNDSNWLWKKHKFSIEHLVNPERFFAFAYPVKIGIILTGKRHKTTRELIREASAAIMMHTYAADDWITLSEYTSTDFCRSRYLAFDLAGSEADNPPERHKIEFEQISRIHIPITIHAGENAPSGYIENAIMDLHARRIGHGLSVTDDPKLLRRIREDGVCIELCPVSNFQTSSFQQAKQNDSYLFRPYPLRELLNAGCNVCICTDNPIISYTNIIKEFFQASYAYSPDGLTLWDALGLIRAGFTNSFLSLPERKSILELVDQILSILLSDKKVTTTLRCLYSLQAEINSES